jgi:uncharacterized protein
MIIDFHTHPIMIKDLIEEDPSLKQSIEKVFGFYFPPQPLSIFIKEMDEAGVDQAVLLPLDCSSAFQCKVVSNQQVARLCEVSDRFIGFASIDPSQPGALAQLEHDILEYGLRGLKLNPALQGFFPNDKEIAYPVYQLCAELKIPIMIHCGLSWAPSGKSHFANPLFLEDVAQDFPQLRMIIGHFGWPWVNEALILGLKNPNVYLDTAILYSGTPGQALRKVLAEQVGLFVIERSLHNKVIFGSDYPRVDIRRSVRAINNLDLPKDVETKIMGLNACSLLSLGKEEK